MDLTTILCTSEDHEMLKVVNHSQIWLGVNSEIRVSSLFIVISVIQYETKLLIWLRNQTLLFWDSYKMALGSITSLSIYWKIIISLNLSKQVVDDLRGSLLRMQVSQILQSLFSMFITLPCILKNPCGIISIPVTEITFNNYYIHILHYLSEWYIYGY